MGAKGFPAASSLKREELEKASTGSGPILANVSCATVHGTLAKIRKAIPPTIRIHRTLRVIIEFAATGVVGVLESPPASFARGTLPRLSHPTSVKCMFGETSILLASLTASEVIFAVKFGVRTSASWTKQNCGYLCNQV